MKFQVLFVLFTLTETIANINNEQLIISLATDDKSINNLELTINSILNQNVEREQYKIILFCSKNNCEFSNNFTYFLELNNIILKVLNSEINLQTRLIESMNYFPKNPILIINDNTIFPEGWLEMFINDHKNYPNDIIAGSIQYYIGKNLEIKTLAEGYNGRYFGIFNHVTNLIFNFAFINTNLGGTLYPSSSFKNEIFYNNTLFYKLSNQSDEFWQSCFIMIENKNLRQSSKIYDYTKYIINKNEINKIDLFGRLLNSFINFFPNFKDIVEERQKKIIISLTSYSKRFDNLPLVISSLKTQSFPIQNIILFLYEKDKKLLDKTNFGIQIIFVKEDIKPHKKYYYVMQKYRNYAIITVDDDVVYCKNFLKSLFNSYLEYPNVVSGRRGHYMKYKKNKELQKYYTWFNKNISVTEPDFKLFLTGVGGIIYPPDILNIKEEFLDLIKEIIWADDLTLKHWEIKKGIKSRLIPNKHPFGLHLIKNNHDAPLYKTNIKFQNDAYIKKINIIIEDEIIKDICVNYNRINTGNIIYLFNINVINYNKTVTNFYIDAYSYCPIDENFYFEISFDKNNIANCYLFSQKEKNEIPFSTKKNGKAFCSIKYFNNKSKNLNNYFFPNIFNEYNINIKFINYKKYTPVIFKDLFYENHKTILELIFYSSFQKGINFKLKTNNNQISCNLRENVNYLKDEIPIIKYLECHKYISYINNINDNISGLPSEKYFLSKIPGNKIINQFIINKIYYDLFGKTNYIIIKGKLMNNLNKNIFKLKIKFSIPNMDLDCSLKMSNASIQSYISCKYQNQITKHILIENQISVSEITNYSLILINSETLILNDIIKFDGDNEYITNLKKKIYNNIILLSIYICIKLRLCLHKI